MRGISQRVVGGLLIAAAVIILGGCQYLFGYPYGPYPVDPSPGPSAAYANGKATLKVGTEPPIDLTELVEGGTMASEFGMNATFRNADGWYLRIMGATKGGNFSSMPTYLTLDRIVDNHHWTTDGSGCSFKIEKADETGLSGTASCKRLRWIDAMGTGYGMSYEPPYIPDQPAFDAEITFEAAPSTTQTS